MKKPLLISAIALSGVLMSGAAQAARDYINIVGSSTVYPFSTVVAERFGKSTQYKTPKVESTGSGGGLKLFCQGVGVQHPDIANASRRIKATEVALCAENGVEEIVEVLIGFDGIVIGNSVEGTRFNLSRRDLFLALAKEVPNPDGSETLVENPYTTWKQVNASLPDLEIEVLGPPPTSGTRDAFAELALEGGCKTYDWIKALKKADKKRYKGICHTVREDGPFIEAGENDNLIVQKLNANPDALGIFGFSFLDQNADQIQGSMIDGVEPTFDSISDGGYPVSRPLYFYVKKAHVGVIPGMKEYLAEFTSNKAFGEEGYLTEKGMIPLGDEKRAEVKANVQALKKLVL
ncbi:PstS family phosphate ABC transporter substrate-binding protein [Aestuariibacter halophilus]|uniref:PstS family phosphate ABC transporter substrate-binding protein n=1 Tax=Fluctibacter halophilus TaxID=226011 RepID=A0ABS8GE49_9ALTE|nr:PstS family phosphate ABC transporter substrate-binding protein [Aestuariibacter halophilus]MCC2618069.1 PstS family phosphate ABC transporter substrate-binding protein [Aestuariibacter halophilus]